MASLTAYAVKARGAATNKGSPKRNIERHKKRQTELFTSIPKLNTGLSSPKIIQQPVVAASHNRVKTGQQSFVSE
jgi:hypothetical protein